MHRYRAPGPGSPPHHVFILVIFHDDTDTGYTGIFYFALFVYLVSTEASVHALTLPDSYSLLVPLSKRHLTLTCVPGDPAPNTGVNRLQQSNHSNQVWDTFVVQTQKRLNVSLIN